MSDKTKSGVFFLLIFFIIGILSYSPLQSEISANAANETLTNSVWTMLDLVFPYFWGLFLFGTVASMLYLLTKD